MYLGSLFYSVLLISDIVHLKNLIKTYIEANSEEYKDIVSEKDKSIFNEENKLW